MMVSFKPQTVSTTVKDVQDRMGVHKSRLTTNTFLIFPQGVECFANEVGDDKPHAGHMDFKISQSVITGSLTPFFDLPDNTRLNANSYFTLIQANGRVRVYSKKLPDSLDAACRRMIPYILF